MKTAGAALVLLAILVSLLLGTLGWFAVGFGVMTDCTTDYSCSRTGCAPCGSTARWINAGGVAQWLLVGAGIALLVRGRHGLRPAHLAIGGATLVVMSVLTVVGTTRQAQQSYCRPGTDGYADSYCSVDD